MRDILEPPSIAGKLTELFQYAGDHGIPLYVLIDEYDNFANTVETDLYNSDMVLSYLKHSIPNRPVPTYLIDTNVRIDHGKLRHLLVVGRQLNGNFDVGIAGCRHGAIAPPPAQVPHAIRRPARVPAGRPRNRSAPGLRSAHSRHEHGAERGATCGGHGSVL